MTQFLARDLCDILITCNLWHSTFSCTINLFSGLVRPHMVHNAQPNKPWKTELTHDGKILKNGKSLDFQRETARILGRRIFAA